MTEATIPFGPANKPVPEATEATKMLFAAALATKLEQGYHVESQTETDAVIFTKGRRKWFGLVEGTQGRLRRISIHEDGSVKTRGL